jgi:glycosyltransferase involved in cell wall biosynthesis
VPFCFVPDPIGGTEVFVSNLARDLISRGVDVLIAAPGRVTSTYDIDGIRVRRFAVSENLNLKQLYGGGDPTAAEEFTKIIDEERPEIVHLHALTAAVSLDLLLAIKRRKIPVVFTYHTPTATCQRGTMMRWGTQVCDGLMIVSRCSACTVHGRGLPRPIADLVGSIPQEFGLGVAALGFRGGAWTSLRMTELMTLRHMTFRRFTEQLDYVVAVCEWVRDVLIANGVPDDKVILSRQGVAWAQYEAGDALDPRPRAENIAFAFVGRMDQTKGLHFLIEALRSLPDLNLKLDIFGIVQTQLNNEYRQEMMLLSRNDSRIVFKEPIPASEVIKTLRLYDFVAVPSQWLETGPLVVLEAFAAGTPVIGSRIGGISELVRHGIDGLLINPSSHAEWSHALATLALNPELRRRLKDGVRPPRSSIDVAGEMLALYTLMI